MIWRGFWHEKVDTPMLNPSKTTPKLKIFRQNSSWYSSTKKRHAECKFIKEHAEVDDFLLKSVDFASFLTGFSTLVRARACIPFFGDRNSEKRIARIRTLARLRRSIHGFEAVVITTPPPPRLRVKGVRFEVICKRTLGFDRFWDGFWMIAMAERGFSWMHSPFQIRRNWTTKKSKRRR